MPCRLILCECNEGFVNLFTPDFMFTTPSGTPSVLFDILTAFFVVMFIAGGLAYWRRAKLAGGNPVKRRFIRRVSSAAMWIAAIGVLLALFIYLQLPYLGMPIWLYILVLYAIGLIGYYVYDLSERYPVAVHQLQTGQEARRFRRPPQPRREPQRPRPPVRGKGKSGRR